MKKNLKEKEFSLESSMQINLIKMGIYALGVLIATILSAGFFTIPVSISLSLVSVFCAGCSMFHVVSAIKDYNELGNLDKYKKTIKIQNIINENVEDDKFVTKGLSLRAKHQIKKSTTNNETIIDENSIGKFTLNDLKKLRYNIELLKQYKDEFNYNLLLQNQDKLNSRKLKL